MAQSTDPVRKARSSVAFWSRKDVIPPPGRLAAARAELAYLIIDRTIDQRGGHLTDTQRLVLAKKLAGGDTR